MLDTNRGPQPPAPRQGRSPRQTLCHLRSAATSCQTLEQEPRHSPGARAQLPLRTPCHSLQTVSPRRPTSWEGEPVSLSVPQAEGPPGVLPGAASLVTVSGAKKGRKTRQFLLRCPGHNTVKNKPPRPPYRHGPITAQPTAPRGTARCPQAGRTPAPRDGDMRTDGQPKGQPGPGEGPTQEVPDRPRNTKDLRAEVPPKRTERHVPHSTKPPRHTGRGNRGPEPCPGPRVPREGCPLRTTTTHRPGTPKTGQGRTLWSHHRETRGSDCNSRGCSPPPPPTPALVPPPPAPGTLPVAPPPSSSSGHSHRQGTRPLREFTQGNSQSLRAAETGTQRAQHPAYAGLAGCHPPPGGAQAVCPSSTCGLSWNENRTPDDVELGSLQDRGGQEEAALEKSQGAGPPAAPQQPWAQGPLV